MQPLITDMDARRLRSLLDTPVARHIPGVSRLLEDKLERARIVPASALPATIVTMNSRVSCWDQTSGRERELALVYPWASSPASGHFSILSRVGVDLLGTIPGRRIFVDGVPWDVLYVAYQPEAERSYHL